jgi:hypothetical protein
VLIFDGEFDQATPVADALKAVHDWPDSTFVEVTNANHVTAQQDSLGCTSVILQRFIASLKAGDIGCAKTIPPVYVVPTFPASLASAPSATRPSSTAGRAVWVAAETIGDALARVFSQVTYTRDSGLYGGSFRITGGVYPPTPIKLHLSSLRFVPDLAISGTVVCDRDGQRRAQRPLRPVGDPPVHVVDEDHRGGGLRHGHRGRRGHGHHPARPLVGLALTLSLLTAIQRRGAYS